MTRAHRKLILTATAAAAIGAATVVTSAASARPHDKDGKQSAWEQATPVGKPVDCIPLNTIRNSQVRSDQVIDFYTTGGKVMRNTLPYSCSSLGFEQRFMYKTSMSQLCSVDIITVLYSSPPMQGASCGLGKFQQVEIPKTHSH